MNCEDNDGSNNNNNNNRTLTMTLIILKFSGTEPNGFESGRYAFIV